MPSGTTVGTADELVEVDEDEEALDRVEDEDPMRHVLSLAMQVFPHGFPFTQFFWAIAGGARASPASKTRSVRSLYMVDSGLVGDRMIVILSHHHHEGYAVRFTVSKTCDGRRRRCAGGGGAFSQT